MSRFSHKNSEDKLPPKGNISEKRSSETLASISLENVLDEFVEPSIPIKKSNSGSKIFNPIKKRFSRENITKENLVKENILGTFIFAHLTSRVDNIVLEKIVLEKEDKLKGIPETPETKLAITRRAEYNVYLWEEQKKNNGFEFHIGYAQTNFTTLNHNLNLGTADIVN